MEGDIRPQVLTYRAMRVRAASKLPVWIRVAAAGRATG